MSETMNDLDEMPEMPSMEEPTQALTVRETSATPAPPTSGLTPQQARVDAVSSVIHKAYERASMLELTPDQAKALKAEFPDEAFKLGAGGNPDLLYIEHAYLRDRFDEVLGMGKWALVRTKPHWAEEYKTAKGYAAVRLYADCALIIQGCLVTEAIGDMTYFPNNPTQNYGDAAEGSETAAFRRCAKKLGVGLQAWKKDFCEEWKARYWRKQHEANNMNKTVPTAPAPAPKPPPPAKPAAAESTGSTVSKAERIEGMKKQLGPKWASFAVDYLRSVTVDGSDANSALMPNETLDDLNEQQVQWLSQNWLHFTKRLGEYISEMNDRVAEFAKSSLPPAAQDDRPFVEGVIESTSVKTGTNKRGQWSNYGIRIEGNYYNTFSKTLGEKSKELKGQKVKLFYKEGEYGEDAIEIVHNGVSTVAGNS